MGIPQGYEMEEHVLKAFYFNDKDVIKEENGPPKTETWSYPSLVGMLLYFSGNSRPDIAFSLNQTARFNHYQRLYHETLHGILKKPVIVV